MEERDEVTATSFRVMVSEAEPYSFQTCAMQQVQSSVRITHITFTPPSIEEMEAYIQQQESNSDSTPGRNDALLRSSTLASLRTLCASGKLESHAVACFPWTVPTDAAALEDMATNNNNNNNSHNSGDNKKHKSNKNGKENNGNNKKLASSSTQITASACSAERVQLAGFFEVALPRQTDICSNVDLRFDVDGSVWLEVNGPGSVTFFGEQYSSLIPEWLSHHFFTVGDDDEEGEDEEGDEDEVYSDGDESMIMGMRNLIR
ncbi:uncharacterized protein TM35_000082970 [Trypanosoma theileri]|uniref:Uncharacterized protein n=1 Tax=Trypanosoma theileri TaxID=67003 RepID=A0A1X0P1T8_9TRYP|nr:uncharacterized protein TM35_000082970 [Trypanosoma theileri]ORC90499.1 hypothetical protein TM35_000082970 [Trypanosoma theileri]